MFVYIVPKHVSQSKSEYTTQYIVLPLTMMRIAMLIKKHFTLTQEKLKWTKLTTWLKVNSEICVESFDDGERFFFFKWQFKFKLHNEKTAYINGNRYNFKCRLWLLWSKIWKTFGNVECLERTIGLLVEPFRWRYR